MTGARKPRAAKPATRKKSAAPARPAKKAASRARPAPKAPANLAQALAEANARVELLESELAVIDSIQEGMASALDFQAIVDLVGDKLRKVFRTGDLSIRWWDREGGALRMLYGYEHGKRLPVRERPFTGESDPAAKVLLHRMTRVLNTRTEQVAAGLTGPAPGTDWAHSLAATPIIGRDRVLGMIVLEDHKREHAFAEPQLRLLQTIASNMGAALENARLFDETQRLFRESEQRAAELAIINSVQEGLASKLEIDHIFKLVGEKIREIFAADCTYIGYADDARERVAFPYYVDRGVVPPGLREGRAWDARRPTERIIEQGTPLLWGSIDEEVRSSGGRPGQVASPGASADLNRSFLGVPFSYRGRQHGVVSVQS
jgi:GAF domain-containing protein